MLPESFILRHESPGISHESTIFSPIRRYCRKAKNEICSLIGMLSNELRPADLEKSGATTDVLTGSKLDEKSTFEAASTTAQRTTHISVPTKFQRWNARIEGLAGLEARGIVRVLPEERQASSNLGYAQMAMVWFGANVVANNLAVGMLGPLLFNLGFVDSAMMATFGSFVGSIPTAYMSIWGGQSGNRTMVRLSLL